MPGISDLQDDPRVNVRQRPTPAGVDGVQHEDGQLMVHDGAGQGGISSLPMQVDIAGQTHILSYLTPEEQDAQDQFLPCCSRAKSARLVLDL